jgi:drug/metabolite transporter (DMT)-like permease
MNAQERRLETVVCTLLALLAFAANSVLTRMALGGGQADAASFTLVRLAAGALTLSLLVRLRGGGWPRLPVRGIPGVVALFAYAAPFTFAYLRIGAAVGSLVVFGAVQLTMIGWGVARGERLGARTTLGLLVAAAGLVALALPKATRPDPLGTILMVVAGAAWGVYSLRGKTEAEPLVANARSFVWSVPLALLLCAATGRGFALAGRAAMLAVASGAVTSGLGYAIWYRALRGLTATRAAIVQLSVPVIAALAAVAALGETLSLRLCACGAAVLGGVALALTAPATRPLRRPDPSPAARAP